jgi:tetratricopeptide (TPR) repeat protein
MFAGHFDTALATLERYRSATENSGQEALRIEHKWYEALNRAGKGEYEPALSLLDDALVAGERYGDALFKGRCLNTLGWIYGELQDHGRALVLNTQSLEVALEQERPDPEIVGNARLNLGDSLMALGRLDEAEEQFQFVEQVVRNPRTEEQWMLWRYSQHLFHSYGELWLARGELEHALAYADECLQLAESSDSTKNIVKARSLRGQVFMAQDEPVRAEQELNVALELACRIGNPPQLWKTWAALGALRQSQGRSAEAKLAYRSALQVVDGVAVGLADKTLRETFLSSPHVTDIRQRVGSDRDHGKEPQ